MSSPPKMVRTETPGVYSRGSRFVAVWLEDGRQRKRSLTSYAEACTFKWERCRGIAERFAEKVGSPDDNGCRPWTGGGRCGGYGGFRANGRKYLARRWAYEQQHGPVPDGLERHHTCENPCCVNVEHLEALTVAEHRRAHTSGKQGAATR